jgi:thiol-disulfide isomerase/thioredoxin
MKRFLSLPVLLAAALSLSAANLDFTVSRYQRSEADLAVETALDTAQTYDLNRAIARDYQSRYPDDMGVQLRVGSLLAMDNLDSTRAFYLARANREPDNEIALYLAGRLMNSTDEQRTYAQRILAKKPSSYWGNLLLAGTYPAETDSGFQLSQDALLKAIRADNSLPFAVERLGNLLRLRGDNSAAEAVFVKLGQMEPNRFEPVQYRIMLAGGDHRQAIRLADEFLAKNPRNVKALYVKANSQRELSDWPGHLSTMRRVVEVERTGPHAYDLACGFSLAGEKDSAYAWLFTAVELGFADPEQYKGDDDLIPLRSDPRWGELLTAVEGAERAKMAEIMRQAAATAPQRKEAALAERQGALAPDFTLKDLNGNTVSLADLRGKVVILDFWATWCGPCRKTMPLLDKFYTEMKPENVVVYGVNVWERGGKTDKVKPFIAERGFHFPVLYGTGDLADAYGVQGIPTLVMIDPQGKVAYRHVGYNPTLAEVLQWQVNELLKKQ